MREFEKHLLPLSEINRLAAEAQRRGKERFMDEVKKLKKEKEKKGNKVRR